VPLDDVHSRVLRASCPARIDIGNSLDYPSFYFSLPSRSAHTMNIAIEKRTSVTWTPSDRRSVTYSAADGPVQDGTGRFAILDALLAHFQVSGGSFHIGTEVPRGTGLGGSGMLVVATLGLLKTLMTGPVEERDWPSIALTAHMFENWLGFSSTGFHDQLAALYGGANLWTWGTHLDSEHPFFSRARVDPQGGSKELERHLILCFTGETHAQTTMSDDIGPLPRQELATWAEISAHASSFAAAVQSSEWCAAAEHLQSECDLRARLRPGCVSERSRLLIDIGQECGIGCRYAGYGHGGCVWGCGPVSAVQSAMEAWGKRSSAWKDAWVIAPGVAAAGLVVTWTT